MKIRPVGAELFREDGQTWRSHQSLFVIFRKPLETGNEDTNHIQNSTEVLAYHFNSRGYRTYW